MPLPLPPPHPTFRFYRHPNLQCGILWSSTAIGRGPGVGLGPTTDRLFLPWSGIAGSWTDNTWSQCPEPEPAQLILSPAPGEMFDLTVQVVDQLLMSTSANAYLQVQLINNILRICLNNHKINLKDLITEMLFTSNVN